MTDEEVWDEISIAESAVEDAEVTNKCLSELIKTLETRMPLIREAEASWKLVPSATEEPIRFDSLIVQSGNVDNIEIMTDEDVLPPRQIEEALNELDRNVSDLSKRQETANATAPLVLNNKIMVDELHVEDLTIDRMNVDYLNDVDMRSETVIFSQGEDQRFTSPLRVKNAIVDELEVESLCGIPSKCESYDLLAEKFSQLFDCFVVSCMSMQFSLLMFLLISVVHRDYYM